MRLWVFGLIAAGAITGCSGAKGANAGEDAGVGVGAGADASVGVGADGDAGVGAGAGEDAGAGDGAGAGFEASGGLSGDDGGPNAPITAPSLTWTWIPTPGAVCGDGSPTGIGINLSPTSPRLLIYLEGGGACWSEQTCFAMGTAANFTTGYDETKFQAEIGAAGATGFFDRTAAQNPFKDYSFVFIPYCSGDLFMGNAVATFGGQAATFAGYANVGAALARVVPTFPAADRVLLSGSSAGGYGAVYNAWRVQQAFGAARIDVVDDSGTFIPADVAADAGTNVLALQAAAWNSASTTPPCDGCGVDPSLFYSFFATTFPTHRIALLSFATDTVIPIYFGLTAAQFTAGLAEDVTRRIAPYPNASAFVAAGSGHVLLGSPGLSQGGVSLLNFISLMVGDDPEWTTVKP